LDKIQLFWETKPLSGMTPEEWDLLCDRCGLCCLRKLEDKDTGKVFYTNVACRLLDIEQCSCASYNRRTLLVPDCIVLDPGKIELIRWLPKTCAYRLLAEWKNLQWWHPLISGSSETVHEAGISVRNRGVISEEFTHVSQLKHHIVDWDI
jgi:uncharacterized cysteine cluster protein YcgN (CxxCxxCC family)